MVEISEINLKWLNKIRTRISGSYKKFGLLKLSEAFKNLNDNQLLFILVLDFTGLHYAKVLMNTSELSWDEMKKFEDKIIENLKDWVKYSEPWWKE